MGVSSGAVREPPPDKRISQGCCPKTALDKHISQGCCPLDTEVSQPCCPSQKSRTNPVSSGTIRYSLILSEKRGCPTRCARTVRASLDNHCPPLANSAASRCSGRKGRFRGHHWKPGSTPRHAL